MRIIVKRSLCFPFFITSVYEKTLMVNIMFFIFYFFFILVIHRRNHVYTDWGFILRGRILFTRRILLLVEMMWEREGG